METKAPISFDDLEDLGFSTPTHVTADGRTTAAEYSSVLELRPVSKRSTPKRTEGARFPCQKCRGSGVYTFGYVNRQQGKCHACNGRGYFTSSPEQRKASRDKAAAAKVAQLAATAAKRSEFLTANPVIEQWLSRGYGRGDTFAMSLDSALTAYGEWTERQLAAVEASIAREARWEAERAAKAAQAATDPNALKLTVPAGLYAVPEGETRLKVRIDRPGDGKWQGFVFVKNGAEYGAGAGTRYGMQRPGGVYQGAITEQLRVINADPRAASAAYGRLTGTCGRCGRKLEDAASIEAGIGPVCAGKDW